MTSGVMALVSRWVRLGFSRRDKCSDNFNRRAM